MGRPGAEGAARPEGPLVWVHADDPARVPAIHALADRLRADGIATLLTLPFGVELPTTTNPLLARRVPSERLGAVRAFLGHWRPDLLLWVGGRLRPALLSQAAMPKLLMEGAPERALLARGSRVPGLARAVVALFDRALAASPEAQGRLGRAGLAADRVAVAPPLDAPAPVLPCNERERRDLAQTIGARPVWLAGDLPLRELPAVAAAHLHASRSAHRLLLLVAPRHPEEADAMARGLSEAGLKVALRADGAEPDEAAQAYLAEGTAEMGLWLRLAPVAFVGGTLPRGPQEAPPDGPPDVTRDVPPDTLGGRHPFEGAALGSALLHGPVTAPHRDAWARLGAAGAARLVRNGAELGGALEALLAPDRVAAMARSAWDVATQGSEVANLVESLIRERIALPATGR